MIKRDKLVVESPLSRWELPLPEGASFGRILGLFDGNGESIEGSEPDAVGYHGGILFADFGFDTMVGTMLYEYEDGKPDGVDPNSKDGVSVVINNGGGCCSTADGIYHPVYEFKDKQEIIIPRNIFKGSIEFLRDGSYAPVVLDPELQEPFLYKFTFSRVESGRVY